MHAVGLRIKRFCSSMALQGVSRYDTPNLMATGADDDADDGDHNTLDPYTIPHRWWREVERGGERGERGERKIEVIV